MNIVVLANTVLVKRGISGGDIVLPFINKYWNGRFNLKVMTTSQGKAVWEHIGSKADFNLLPHLKYEDYEWKFTFLFTYIIRTIFAYFRLKKMTGKGDVVLSASDFFPDVLPSYLLREHKKFYWVARVYHLIKSPSERKGSFLLNILSYALQKISLDLIKKRADLVLTPVGTYKDLLGLGFRESRVAISNPGVDIEEIDSVQKSDKAIDAIYIGALLFNKGSYDIPKIWAKVVEKLPKARLIVIGGGPKHEVEAFRNEIQEKGLSGNIEYLGFVKDIRDVYAQLKASRLLILTGHENGWSIPVSEAFACGIPVVAYNLKMFGTAFTRGFITVPLHDIDAFAQEAISVLTDDKKRQNLANEAYREGRQLGWDKIAIDLAKNIGRLAQS